LPQSTVARWPSVTSWLDRQAAALVGGERTGFWPERQEDRPRRTAFTAPRCARRVLTDPGKPRKRAKSPASLMIHLPSGTTLGGSGIRSAPLGGR